jgi:hypothetical protein
MSYLRFSPNEYHAIRRLTQAISLAEVDPPALQHYLVAHLPAQRLQLALRVARLNNRQMQLLREHFLVHQQSYAPEGDKLAFTEEELEVVSQAIDFPRHSLRFLRLFQKSMVDCLSEASPSLAGKLARLSERQFGRFYEYVKGRKEGSA